MTRREILQLVRSAAEPLYGAGEAGSVARMVLEELGGVSWSESILRPDEECEIEDFSRIADEIKRGRPIQYIIGRAEFCDLSMVVREGVLIPRPESEELVRWVVGECRGDERVLDLCSGSGALAIAISCKLADAEVSAVELSDEALAIAKENIERLAPSVKLIKGDVLEVERLLDGSYSVIVANPPYIPCSERVDMRTNVVDYEPSMALFVPDDDPLLFYRSIAKSGLKLLKSGGKIYFEVHENFASQTAEMMAEMGYRVEIRADINDKPRMVCGVRG
ncbi:MAG: peptide chain release factor N(5)-glutamine methyltransferase [Rikenellaceae bacterium]